MSIVMTDIIVFMLRRSGLDIGVRPGDVKNRACQKVSERTPAVPW